MEHGSEITGQKFNSDHLRKNLNALYPYLSSYLGHVSYTETDYYVHLSTDFYSDIESKMQGVNDYLYGDDDDE